MSDVGSPAEERAPERDDDEVVDAPQDGDLSDKDSDLLSEIDEDQFEDDFNPGAEEHKIIDAEMAQTLKASKRKRTDAESTKKPKEGRRPKKRSRNDDVDFDDVGERTSRPRKSRTDGEERRAAKKDAAKALEESEEHLSPEERRRRALDRMIDQAIKNPSKRRKKKDDIVCFTIMNSTLMQGG